MAECSAVLPAVVVANSLSKIPREISQRQTRVSETCTRYEPPSTALRRSASSTPTVPNQPRMLSTMGSIGGCLGSSRVPPRANILPAGEDRRPHGRWAPGLNGGARTVCTSWHVINARKYVHRQGSTRDIHGRDAEAGGPKLALR